LSQGIAEIADCISESAIIGQTSLGH
jgi:hypothetical protein